MVTITISQDDYLNAQRLHRRNMSRWYFRGAALAIVAGTVLALAGEGTLGLTIVGAGVGGAAGEVLTASVYLPWMVGRLYRGQPELAKPVSYSWDDEMLEASAIGGSSRRPWGAYLDYKENEKIVLLYLAKNAFEMFPKKWFVAPGRLDEFRKLAGRRAAN